MEERFSQNGYEVTLERTDTQIKVIVEHKQSFKVYSVIINESEIPGLQMLLISNIDDLYEGLITGFKKIDESTISLIEEGPTLFFQASAKIGRHRKEYKYSWGLKEEKLGPLTQCEKLLGSLIETHSNKASVVEGQLFKILQKFLEFGKHIQEGVKQRPPGIDQSVVVDLSKRIDLECEKVTNLQVEKINELEQKLTDNINKVGLTANQKFVNLEHTIKQVEKNIENLKAKDGAGTARSDNDESNMGGVNKKIESLERKVDLVLGNIKESQEHVRRKNIENLKAKDGAGTARSDNDESNMDGVNKKIESLERKVELVLGNIKESQEHVRRNSKLDDSRKNFEANTKREINELREAIGAKLSGGSDQKEIEELKRLIKDLENRGFAKNDNHDKKIEEALEKVKIETEKLQKLQNLAGEIAGPQGAGDKINHLEYLCNYFSPKQSTPVVAVPFPTKEIVQAEAYIQNGYEYELFRTGNQFLIQVEEINTGKIFYKLIAENSVKGFTLNNFNNIPALFEGLAEALKNPGPAGTVSFEGTKLSFAKQRKFGLTLDQANLSQVDTEKRSMRKLTDGKVEPQYFFERRLRQALHILSEQANKMMKMILETSFKSEQLEKLLEEYIM